MGVKERVLTARLLNKLEKNPGLAERLGILRDSSGEGPATGGKKG